MTDTQQISEGFFPTTNTLLAAALTTLGVEFKKKVGLPSISNVYDASKPFRRDGRGQVLPGEVTYYLENGDKALGRPFNELILGWEEGKADLQFCEALTELREAAKTVPVVASIVAKLDSLFPAMLMAHARGIADNRNRIADEWKRAMPYLRFKRPNGTDRLISKAQYDKMSPAQKKEFLNR